MTSIPGRDLRATKHHLRLIASNPTNSVLPRTRGECRDGPRPCPLISCRHHLAVDVTFAGGVAIHWLPEEEPERQTCSLDLAERGGMGMDEVGLLLGCSKERVRQIEESALASLTELMTDER